MTEEKETMVPETENVPEPEETIEAEVQEETAEAEKGKKDKKSDAKKLKAELEELKKALEEEQKKAAEAGDKYLRVCAEYDNFRKRTQKEKETAYGEAVADTVKGLLPVIDNLQYASKYGNADPEKFAEGVKLILDKLPETLPNIMDGQLELPEIELPDLPDIDLPEVEKPDFSLFEELKNDKE